MFNLPYIRQIKLDHIIMLAIDCYTDEINPNQFANQLNPADRRQLRIRYNAMR